MKKNLLLLFSLLVLWTLSSCTEVLKPKPIDQLTDDVVLNEPADVPNVEIGMYAAFRPIAAETVIAGDATADMLLHIGTFTQYRELCNKEITSANASVVALWSTIYNTIYICNFVLERLPTVPNVKSVDRDRVMGTAHFLRGYCYFVALNTFGAVPLVTTTSLETNSNIPRATKNEVLEIIQSDYNDALTELPEKPVNTAFAGQIVVRAALAKLNLFLGNWSEAENYASDVISSGFYSLDSAYSDVVTKDFPLESIFEMGYNLTDDPGTDNNIGLNNIFVGRREMIPSNETVLALSSGESGKRFSTIKFDVALLKGNDNGWTVAKYGTADQNNNNTVVFRLGEIYLIRAEARAQLNKISGSNGALADIKVLRKRAHATASLVTSASQSLALTLIEKERVYELAYEGNRWYDLVRTGRAQAVIAAFNSNWKDTYELWPIPQRELLTNKALQGEQNPGY